MKKIIITSIAIILSLAIIASGVYFFLSKKEVYKLTAEEQQWVENNKNNGFDLYMPSDIPLYTVAGKGVLFDFVNFFSKETGIKFNPVAYQNETDINGEYSIVLTNTIEQNDIKISSDEYVVMSNNEGMIPSVSSLSSNKIGILESELSLVKPYLGENLAYVTFKDKQSMLAALSSKQVNSLVGLKTTYTDEIITDKLHINYHISDLKKYYVLRSSNNNKVFNSIIKKEIKKFVNDQLNKSYNSNLYDLYVKSNQISEQEITDLNSKKYTYGYINDGIYDTTYHKELSGTNYFIVKSFASFSNLDMKYEKPYSNLKELNDALVNNKIDFYFNNTSFNNEGISIDTVKPITSKIVFVTRNDKKISLNSINSLKDYKVSVLENSYLEKILTEKGISVKKYSNYKKMFKTKNQKNDDVIAIELENYEYYKTRSLRNYHISYIMDESFNYGFTTASEYELFNKLFNFYLEYVDTNRVIDINYANVYEYEGLNIVLLVLVIVLSAIIIFNFIGKIRKTVVALAKHKENKLTKETKIKYIDSLTSLKNRAYLNDNIEKWDDSEVYPQIIIIIDLNNISYINDNYGHEEGDKVITEAANILIQTQLPNTEIIRTDGNEFLVYMIDYEEKKAVAYIRRLNREFKNLTHGFSAAIGYSIINDPIKTIDDAVNEATLDMKTNKETMMNEEK